MPKLTNTLNEIFSNRMFRIPDYQRGYAWEREQWNDLVEDLELLHSDRDHFTGMLVLCSVNEGAKIEDRKGWSYSVYEVIDGQQRLTTALLFLHAIYAEMQRIDWLQDMADGLWERYLAVRDENGQWLTKLTLNQDCQDFYFEDILDLAPGVGGPMIRSHKLLAGAKAHFAGYLSAKGAELGSGYADWLRALCFKITRHLTHIVYEVDNTTDASVIFETMNDRGKQLTELELVKNYLLYVASKLDLPAAYNLSEQINQTWKHIFESLMTAGLGTTEHEDRLLRAHWLMAYDHNRRHWKRSRSIKDRFSLRDYQDRHPELLRDLQDYLHTLKSAVTAYCDIHCPEYQMAFNDCADAELRVQIVDASKKLVRLETRATFLPLLMAVRLRTTDGGETYRKAVKLCERFDFRVYQWSGYRSTTGRSRLLYLGHRFFRDQDAQRMLYDVARAILSYCSDAQFAARFGRETENWYRWGGLKYFLYEYEQHLAREEREPVQVQWGEIWNVKRDTIEHILPQTPTDVYWREHFTDEQRRRWTHDIGNLTLTYDNSYLGNKPFPDKKGNFCQKNCYATSKLFIEQQLARCQDWKETQIQERRERIRQWAVGRWRVEMPPLPPPPPSSSQKEGAEEHILRLADEYGRGEEFRTILSAARKHPRYLYPVMHPMWRVIRFAPPQNGNKPLFWLGADLWVGFTFENFERFLGIPAQEAQAILGPEKDYVLERSQTDEFVARLDRLIERIREIHGANA